MSMLLQVVIALAVTTLTATLVPLFLQLRRTARSVETLAEQAGRDLSQVAEDLHATRIRVEGLADLAQRGLEHPGPLGQVIFGLVGALPALLRPSSQEGTNFIALFVTALRSALSFFRGAPQAAPKEGSHE